MALRWWMLLILFLVRLAMGYEFQAVGSVSGHLVGHFAISYTQVGALIGLFLLPGVVIAMPSGLLTQAIADRRLVILGALMMIAGSTTMAFAQGIGALFAGRFLVGIGGAIFNVVLTKMMTDWFAGHRIVTAMGLLLAAWPSGIALGVLSQGAIADTFGWPWAMHAATGSAAAAAVLTATFYRDAPHGKPTGGPLRLTLPRRAFAMMSLVGIGWGVYNASAILVISFAPDHLEGLGYSIAGARWTTSLFVFGLLIFVPLSGPLVEASGQTNAAIYGGLGFGALSVLVLERGVAPEAMMVTFAVLSGLCGAALMSLSSQAVAPEDRGPGLGLFFTWYYATMAISPTLAGFARDVTGDTGAPLVLAAIAALGAVATTLAFRAMQARGGPG